MMFETPNFHNPLLTELDDEMVSIGLQPAAIHDKKPLSPASCRLIYLITKKREKLAVEKLELDGLCKEKNQLRKDNFKLGSEVRLLKRTSLQENTEGINNLSREVQSDSILSRYINECEALCMEKNRLRQVNFHIRHEGPIMRRDSLHKQTKEISDYLHQIEEMRNIYNDLQASIEMTSCEKEILEVTMMVLKSEVKKLLMREDSVSIESRLRHSNHGQVRLKKNNSKRILRSQSLPYMPVTLPGISSQDRNISSEERYISSEDRRVSLNKSCSKHKERLSMNKYW